jgi:hypothetical protein
MYKQIVIFILLFSQLSFACKPVKKFSVEETLINADSVIIATAIGFKTVDNTPHVLFEVDQIVHGHYSKQYLLIKGNETSHSIRNSGEVPYSKGRRFLPGQCNSENYEYGGIYLLFLKSNSPYWSAFNPVNEKIAGIQDPWLLWVKGFYAGREYNNQK